MKKMFVWVLLFAGLVPVFGVQPRIVEISSEREKITELEIVVEKKLPVLNFAASELQQFLKHSAGISAAVKSKVSPGRISLILGDCSSAKAAGIDVKKLPPEGYYIIRKGKKIFLAGQDHATRTPPQNSWEQTYKRGTLSAVYDFLERFAGIRFYFPGAHGTIVPVKKGLYLPVKIHILERPDMPTRNYYVGRTQYYPGFPTGKGRPSGETLTRIRLRTSEFYPAYGHGLTYLNLIKRFSKSHPEYFALLPDGRRYYHSDLKFPGQLCYNSSIREEIFQDAKAYFSGKPAASRGIRHWHYNVARNGYFSLAPQDWQYWCGCEKCRKVAEPGRGKIFTDPVHRQAVSDFMWEFTSEIAERLEKDGIKNYMITQHVYPPMNLVPKKKLHKNIKAEICIFGKGGDRYDTEVLRKWYGATGNKMDVWTYSIGKHMAKKIPGVAPMYPRGIARFVDDNKQYISGGMYESESDYFLLQYLNLYVWAKKAWNNSLKVEDILKEHSLLMFGKGAPMMMKFYDALEEAWGNRILGTTIDSGLGPTTKIPSEHQIWSQIYSMEKMKKFHALFDAALKAASGDKGAVSRIKFIREHLFGPMEKESKKYSDAQKTVDSWIVNCPGVVYLRPGSGEVNEVSTKVAISKTADAFVFEVDCEEPRMKDLKAKYTSRDNPKTYEDSDVEIMLNPSGDRKNYYQFVVNANGALSDYRWIAGERPDIRWNSSATAKVTRRADSWSVTLTVPLKDLGKIKGDSFPVNFGRSRNLKGKTPRIDSYYWGPVPRRNCFHSIENWGVLSFKPAGKYLLKQDFSGKKLPYCWRSSGAKGGQEYGLDKRVFITSGQSLHLKNVLDKHMGMAFYMPEMKPGKRYRLSFYMKTDLRGDKGGAYISLYYNKKSSITLPRRLLSGKVPWHRIVHEFTAPASTGKGGISFVSCSIFKAGGDAWFDQIEVQEIP